MKALRILGRNIRDSFKSVFRNFSLSLASISCITITLVVVAFSIIMSYNVNYFTDEIESDVTIVTFLDVDIDDAGRSRVSEEIKKLDNIESISFESKKEIANQMMESSEVYKNIMSDWTDEESPLQDTYLVKVKDVEQIGATAKNIGKIKGVDVVKYGEGMVEQLVSIFEIVKKISWGVVVALIIVTAFLIGNTIKITIFSRKREIEIMRLVGASNLNIKIPFIFEGLILGMLGSIIPILVTIYGYTTLYNKLGGKIFSSIIRLINPTPFTYLISGVLLAIGMVVGMLGSVRAVRKHLKV
mgnify:CR=1 FL=1